MDAKEYVWSEVEEDNPIPLLYRKRVWGENMLVAKVVLKKGCHVTRHAHPSEQMSVMISGRVLWTLGEGRRQVELSEGQMLHIPGDVLHEVVALEDTEIIDILSPPAAMGVDSQGKA